jgi:hypothetical protein
VEVLESAYIYSPLGMSSKSTKTTKSEYLNT